MAPSRSELFGKGILLLSPDGSALRILNRETGLFDNVVFDFEMDDEAGLWVAFNTGITPPRSGRPIQCLGC